MITPIDPVGDAEFARDHRQREAWLLDPSGLTATLVAVKRPAVMG